MSINKATSTAAALLSRNIQRIALSGNTSVTDPPWGSAVGVAQASIAWEDTVTIAAGGLYQYTVHWHGDLSASGLADLDFGGSFATFVFSISGDGYSNTIARTISTDPGSPQTLSLDKVTVFQATAGQVLHLMMNLDSEASSGGNAFADALHSASFNIDPVTPGGNYTTASGYTYSSEVPEPAPLISTSCALLILVGLKLRSRRSMRR